MPTRNSLFAFAAAALLALTSLTGCAAQGFNERMAGGYSTVSFVRDSAGTLLDGAAITAAEAENLQAQADNLRGALDITREVARNDVSTAEGKLQATLTAIDALRAYLVELGNRKHVDTGGAR